MESPRENRQSVVIVEDLVVGGDIPDPIAIQMKEYRCKQKEKFTTLQSIKKIPITARDQVIKQTENYRKSQPVRKKEKNKMVSATKSTSYSKQKNINKQSFESNTRKYQEDGPFFRGSFANHTPFRRLTNYTPLHNTLMEKIPQICFSDDKELISPLYVLKQICVVKKVYTSPSS